MRSCITQAISQSTEFLWLAEAARRHSDSQIAAELEFVKLFSDIARTDTGLTIIVDGFDECHEFESDVQRRCGFGRDALLQRLRLSVTGTSSHLLVISREEVDIRSALGRAVNSELDNDVIESCMQQGESIVMFEFSPRNRPKAIFRQNQTVTRGAHAALKLEERGSVLMRKATVHAAQSDYEMAQDPVIK